MPQLQVRLFGSLLVCRAEHVVCGLESRKVQELFCRLLLMGTKPQPREALAGVLWGDGSPNQTRKALRQSLWQLQAALAAPDEVACPVLAVGPDSISINRAANLWVDIFAFEEAVTRTQGIPGSALDAESAASLRQAADLYQGDLLEGWYHDWCLCERERFQSLYLTVLDKLCRYCETQHEFETGIGFAARALHYDRARERTHRQLMRLYYLADDRSTALRQYDRCVEALREELGVQPSQRTDTLAEQIRNDRLDASASDALMASAAMLGHTLDNLKQMWRTLVEAEHQVRRNIQLIEETMRGQH
jgi:DNA-binding SARP family transcriptional activator